MMFLFSFAFSTLQLLLWLFLSVIIFLLMYVFQLVSVNDPTVIQAKAGDRVVIPVRIGDEFVAERLMVQLQEKGVEVELRKEKMGKVASGVGVGGIDHSLQGSFLGESGVIVGTEGELSEAVEMGEEFDASLISGPSMMEAMDPLSAFRVYMGTSQVDKLLSNNGSSVVATNNSSRETTTTPTATDDNLRKQHLHSQVL